MLEMWKNGVFQVHSNSQERHIGDTTMIDPDNFLDPDFERQRIESLLRSDPRSMKPFFRVQFGDEQLHDDIEVTHCRAENHVPPTNNKRSVSSFNPRSKGLVGRHHR